MTAFSDISATLADALAGETFAVLAPCRDDGTETSRCLPADAEFWTCYIAGVAQCDLISAAAATGLALALWDRFGIEIEFDLGTRGFPARDIERARGHARFIASQSEYLGGKIQTLLQALDLASSSHGRFELLSRFPDAQSALARS